MRRDLVTRRCEPRPVSAADHGRGRRRRRRSAALCEIVHESPRVDADGNDESRQADPRSDRRPPAGVPPDPPRAVRGRHAERLVRGARRPRRRQRGQGPQGPQLPRHVRHPRRRLRGRVPHLPGPPRARADPRLAGRHRRRRQPRPGARRLRRLRRAGLPGRRHRRHRRRQGRHRHRRRAGPAGSTSWPRSCAPSRCRSASSPRRAAAAQEAADRLVKAGVTSILNFAPVVLSVPPGDHRAQGRPRRRAADPQLLRAAPRRRQRRASRCRPCPAGFSTGCRARRLDRPCRSSSSV